MKKIHNYIMLLFVAFAVASCAEEEIIENKVVGKPGEEVKFSLSLNKKSRTVYGDEINNTFPIYWVDGDKVQVYSPQALTGRNNAEYKVILPKDQNGVVVEKPDYAGDLEKTGDYGVQWGVGYEYKDENGETHTGGHDFYSIYPSGNYKFSKVSNEDGSISMVASGLKVSSTQEISVVNNKYVHDMSNCLMYATTPKVDMEVGVVDLSYSPLSTVLWFELTAGETTSTQVKNDFNITGIELSSNGSNIAGSFMFDVSKGKFYDWTENGGTNKIAVTIWDKSGTQEVAYALKAGKTIEFPIFIAPGTELDLADMTITVNTAQGTYKKTLSKENTDLTLTAGQIHKVKLPNLTIEDNSEWDPATWMKYIPRNVYLSEISIPGSWNSLNVDAQGTSPTIVGQYENGVRAFHLDTRWKRTGSSSNYTYELGIAVGGSNNTTSGDNKYMTAGATFEDAMDEVLDNVKGDEYMVVLCSFAANSAQYNGANGWINAISEYCSAEGKVYDAKNLTANTLVGDVLGKVIVIVNTEGSVSTIPDDSRCLFINMPMSMRESDFDEVLDNRISDIYKGTASSTTASDAGIDIYHTHAQASIRNDQNPYSGSGDRDDADRGFMPTRAERKVEIENILNWSKENYGSDEFEHNKWIYLGLGGYYVHYSWWAWREIDNPNTTVAEDFNPWINTKVTEMDGTNVKYHPVGIVLMNYANSYANTAVKNILLLNNKYRLQYDSSKPVDYKPSETTDSGTGGGGSGI